MNTYSRVVLFSLLLSVLPRAEALADETFTVRMPNYFTEVQGGHRVDMVLTIEYDGVLPQSKMPDYRLCQILAEDTLYSVPDPLTFWEIINREIVRRILVTFPQIRHVESELTVSPREQLSLRRYSTVRWAQSDLEKLGPGREFTFDQYRQARPDSFNVLVPRSLKDTVEPARQALAAGAGGRAVVIDLAPYPLEGSDQSYAALFKLLRPAGLYDALILPESAPHKLEKVRDLTALKGLVKVFSPNPAAASHPGTVEISLGMTLGLEPSAIQHANLGDARENFFYYERAAFLVVESRYAFPYTSRGYRTEPFLADRRVALYAPSAAITLPKSLDDALAALR